MRAHAGLAGDATEVQLPGRSAMPLELRAPDLKEVVVERHYGRQLTQLQRATQDSGHYLAYAYLACAPSMPEIP